MVRRKTVGIVVFRRVGKSIRYLLLHHGGDYWNAPKGRQEAGEDELTTALRELREETGIGISDIHIIENFRDQYDYDFDDVIKEGVRRRVYKQAVFFIGEVKSDKVVISDEHLDYGWFDYETALKRMFYQEGQNLLKRTHQFLLKQQDFVL